MNRIAINGEIKIPSVPKWGITRVKRITKEEPERRVTRNGIRGRISQWPQKLERRAGIVSM
jgi:hypothetical protein